MKKFNYKPLRVKYTWESLLPKIFKNEQTLRYLNDWFLYKRGIQEFPTDPLNPANWEENN